MADSAFSLPSSVWTFSLRDDKASEQLRRCYRVWKTIAEGTFRELGERRKLASDSFFNSHFCHSYWHDGQPVGTLLLTEYLTGQPGLSELSEFRGWPEEFFSGLTRKRIARFGVLSHLGVLEAYRQSDALPSVSESLCKQAVIQAYRTANFDDLFMLSRRTWGVSKVFESLGGKVLYSTVHKGEMADLLHLDLRKVNL